MFMQNIIPEQFKNYHPTKCATITQKQAEQLAGFIRAQDSQHMLLYIWRFAFGISTKIVEQYAKVENTNGIIEAFRFACKRYLDLEKPISDAGMAKAFQFVLQDYEVMLLSSEKGICWISGTAFDYSVTIREAITDMEQRQIALLEEAPLPTMYAKLNPQQIKSLAKHITNLPLPYGGILYSCCVEGLSCLEVECRTGIPSVRGTVEYIRALLTHKLRLPRPVSNFSIRQAITEHTNIPYLQTQNTC